MHARPLALLGVLALATLAGCLGGNGDDGDGDATGLVAVQDRRLQPYYTNDSYSHTLVDGPYAIRAGERFDVPVALPLQEGGNALTGDAAMSLGLFLPEIPGCDWTAASLPAHCHIPVVADAGPYYASSTGISDLQGDCEILPTDIPFVGDPCIAGEGDTIATEPAHRLGGFLIENLVPHGYAVAQVSVFGTGDSNHCQDLMGTAEQLGLDAAVTWLGTQPWSNGRVALIGRSYDGSTPWEAAMFGNPHLASIVPISGLTSQYDLMYHNGSSETRGPGVLYALYAAMTIDGEASDGPQTMCPDYLTGSAQGARAALTGDPMALDPYWSERDFLARALANYDGSIYMIHGLQDWNVEPHMAFPAYNLFEAKGNEVKALLGQWGHMYPDRPGEHENLGEGRGAEAYPESVRYDWAQDLLEWFDYTLKQTGPKPAMHVEVQDNQGQWRIEPTWPPTGNLSLVQIANPLTPDPQMVSLSQDAVFDLGPLGDEDVRIAGLPHLEQSVTPTGPGGQLYALLADGDTGLHLGHAILDLRYADGGRTPQPVVPGLSFRVRMEFEPMDVVLPAGHHLHLTFAVTGEDYVSPAVTDPVLLGFGEGNAQGNVVELPIVRPTADQFFLPPAWEGTRADDAPTS